MREIIIKAYTYNELNSEVKKEVDNWLRSEYEDYLEIAINLGEEIISYSDFTCIGDREFLEDGSLIRGEF